MSVYIDWSTAPEGTTHAYVGFACGWKNGVPVCSTYWESWSDGVVYEWKGRWVRCLDVEGITDPGTRVEKPKEKVMNTASLEQNIERMKKELADMEAKLKAGEKWDPKGGDWFVDFNGSIDYSTSPRLDHIAFGTAFQTKEQAKVASKLMRERNRIIQYVLEHEPNWKFKNRPFEPNYYVYYDYSHNKWKIADLRSMKGQHIYMSEWVAKKLASDLNSGRVVL